MQDLDEVLSRVKNPRRRSAPPPQTLAFPGSARYEIIRQALEDDANITYQQVADEYVVTIREVRKIAERENLQRSEPQNTKTYNKANRIRLNDQLFQKIEDLLGETEDAQELQRLASAYAVATDKRRLEDGEVTSRSETVTNDDARNSLKDKLNLLAERRRQGAAMIDAIQNPPPPQLPPPDDDENETPNAVTTTTYEVLPNEEDETPDPNDERNRWNGFFAHDE